MKKCTNQSILYAQDKAIWGDSWHGGQDGKKQWKRNLKLEFSIGQVPCLRVWGCPRKLTSRELH